MSQIKENNVSNTRGEFKFFVPKDKSEITTQSMGGRTITAKLDPSSEDVKVRLLTAGGQTLKSFFLNAGKTRTETINEPVKAEVKKLTNDKQNQAHGVFETRG